MPNITIQWYAGRTEQQKRQIVAAITDAMVKIGKTTPDQVHIVFQDVEKPIEAGAVPERFFVATHCERQARKRPVLTSATREAAVTTASGSEVRGTRVSASRPCLSPPGSP